MTSNSQFPGLHSAGTTGTHNCTQVGKFSEATVIVMQEPGPPGNEQAAPVTSYEAYCRTADFVVVQCFALG